MVNTKHDAAYYDSCSSKREIYDANSLYDAYILAKRGSDWKESVQKFEINHLKEISKLQHELKDRTYNQKESHQFVITERGKTRVIFGDHIRDRVVKHALCDDILLDAVLPYLIYDNGASLKNKGLSFTRKRVVVHLHKYYMTHQSNNGYVLLMDYSKYYDSIIHSVLLDMLKNKIDNDTAWWLIKSIINDGSEKGLKIGDQTAQISGIYYPTRRDNYIKIVKSCKYYNRYMDDSIIIHESKEFLQDLLEDLIDMSKQDGIIINQSKSYICKLNSYWKFCQIYYSLTDTGRVIQKINPKRLTRMRKRMKKLAYILPFEDFYKWYKSWFKDCYKFMSRKQRDNMDKLFKEVCNDTYIG